MDWAGTRAGTAGSVGDQLRGRVCIGNGTTAAPTRWPPVALFARGAEPSSLEKEIRLKRVCVRRSRDAMNWAILRWRRITSRRRIGFPLAADENV